MSTEDDALARISDAERLQLLIEAVTDYAIYMIDPEGRVVSWNSGAQRIKGYPAEEVLGQHFSIFYTAQDREAGTPAVGLENARRTGRHEAEGWRVRKNGERFWASVVIDAIRDDAGRLIGFAKITRDVTERRNAQIALQEARDQLAQAQKMEALGQLTGGIAHDFNNLLMVVLGNARIVRGLVGGNERAERALQAIEHAAQHGEALTRQLLTFSRRQRLEPQRIVLKDWIDGFVDVLSSSLSDKVKLVTDIAANLPVEVDAREFELALLNLAINARDAMPDGGTLTISARDTRVRRGSLPRRDIDGDFVALSVADTGTGIDPKVLENIFEPFFTTKPPGEGTGLGLSQVHGFITQSGGDVTVESAPGAGTCITLFLPCATVGVAPREEGRQKVTLERGSGRTVLLVEDNVDVAAVAAHLLKQLGYQVITVRTAEMALQKAAESPIDLVFCDIVILGPMDGLALADAVTRRWPHVPVLLTTAYSRVAEEAARRYPILRKPYGIEELSAALERLTVPDRNEAAAG